MSSAALLSTLSTEPSSSLPRPTLSSPISIPKLVNYDSKRVITHESSSSASNQGPKRAITHIFQEIAEKHQLEMAISSKGWTFKFTNPKTGISGRISGYKSDLNPGAAQQICDHKANTFEELDNAKVPAIEHQLFIRDCNVAYVDESGSLEQIYAYTEKFGYNVVCKPVSESGGKGVSHVRNKRELNNAVMTLFAKSPTICISPYAKFTYEYRVIMLEKEPQLVFKKTRPHLIGDGKSTALHLLTKWGEVNTAAFEKMDLSKLPKFPSHKILDKGEIFELGWQHNLCNGASAEVLPLKKELMQKTTSNTSSDSKQRDSNDQELLGEIIEIAKKAVVALGMRFCSVDIVELSDEGLKLDERLKVLEVNSGVLMENFIKQHGDKGYKKAKSIYEKAVCKMLGIKIANSSNTLKLSSSNDSDESNSPEAPSQRSTTPSPHLSHRDDEDSTSPLTISTVKASTSAPTTLVTVAQRRMLQQLELEQKRPNTPTLLELVSKKPTNPTRQDSTAPLVSKTIFKG